MTLAFSTELKGKATYFPYKILNGLVNEELIKISEYRNCIRELYSQKEIGSLDCEEKLTTIRVDEHDRWKAGNFIHFVINNRTPQRYQFAPVVKCISVQEIIIRYMYDKRKDGFTLPYVFIDGEIKSMKEIEALALNDGFESKVDFFKYFNEDFNGKIIHWTDLKY